MDGLSSASLEAIEQKIQAAIRTEDYRHALDLLAHTYLDTVFRYCFRMLSADTARARDVTQQVFEVVCKGIIRYRGEASVKTWLLAIAHKQCLKEIATRERRQNIFHRQQQHIADQLHDHPIRGTATIILSEEWLTRLAQALEQIEPAERSLLIMRFGIGVSHELSPEEIARVLGLSRATVYRKLQEALGRLRRMMHDDTA